MADNGSGDPGGPGRDATPRVSARAQARLSSPAKRPVDAARARAPAARGWVRPAGRASLAEVYRSVPIRAGWSPLRKLLAFAGPGYLVAVGYMDPGNWATSLAGGSAFGYTLLSVVLLSNLMAMLLQALAVRLGIATGRDLAQACRDHYRPAGRARALGAVRDRHRRHRPRRGDRHGDRAEPAVRHPARCSGVVLTALDVLLILCLQNARLPLLEALIIALIARDRRAASPSSSSCPQPALGDVLGGFMPTPGDRDATPTMLYIAIGILGATVMPHNLYLHSAIVQTRRYDRAEAGKREAIRFASIDSTIALMLRAVHQRRDPDPRRRAFHEAGHAPKSPRSRTRYQLLAPLLGAASPARCSRSRCSPRARTRRSPGRSPGRS